ncbi:MAG: hypothetical protein ACI8QZ_003349 [Chlamydiales bacterium]
MIAAEAVWGVERATEFLRFSSPGYVPDQCARGYFEILRSGRDIALNDPKSGGNIDHTLSDAKGHWVVHMLRRRVGDEVFFTTMRALIAEFTDSQMSLDDLRARFIAAAPDAGLEPFFVQWIERTGALVLVRDWSVTESGIELSVVQMQESEAFDLWVDGLVPRSDGVTWECSNFQTDGTHPAMPAEQFVGTRLLEFMLQSPFSAPWFRTSSAAVPAMPRWGAIASVLSLLALGVAVLRRGTTLGT